MKKYKMYCCNEMEFFAGHQGHIFTASDNLDKLKNMAKLKDYVRIVSSDGETNWYFEGQIIDYNREFNRDKWNFKFNSND